MPYEAIEKLIKKSSKNLLKNLLGTLPSLQRNPPRVNPLRMALEKWACLVVATVCGLSGLDVNSLNVCEIHSMGLRDGVLRFLQNFL